MYVKFWGVRGSYPVPGPATNRIGGNTSCVQVNVSDDTTIIIDAGTGIRRLGQHLSPTQAKHCHLLISHTHWDHIQGLPFFAPLYVEGNHISIYARQRDVDLRTVFANQTLDPYFPVNMDDVDADVQFVPLTEGDRFTIDNARVTCARLNHPYIAIGYRIEFDGCSVAYVSDTAPFNQIVLGYEFISETPKLTGKPADGEAAELAQMRKGVIDLCRDADLVIYDTMFEIHEYKKCPHWGHSAPEHAVAVVEEANAATLALFHHHPSRDDDAQDAICRRVDKLTDRKVLTAYEGLVVRCQNGSAEVVS